MSRTKRTLLMLAGAWLVAFAPALRAAESSADEARRLIEVLKKADASLFDKAKACQRLAVVGGKEAIAPLAALLLDEKLAHYARFGLEPIPDPSVNDALRDGLSKLDLLRVGIIGSMGARRDARALSTLTPLLGDPDQGVATAAAAAIGRIGTAESATILRSTLGSARGGLQAAVGMASLACAEAALAAGRKDEALGLYDAVRAAELPAHLRAAGLCGAISARGAAGAPLLVEAIEKGDRDSIEVAFGVARVLPGTETTLALVAALGKLSPERRALAIAALGDRGDKAGLPAVTEAARSGSIEVRLAAIRALRPLGNASVLPILLEAAASEGPLGEAAGETLGGLQGKEIDEGLLALLDGTGSSRALAIDLAGERRIAAAVPILRRAAGDGDEKVRLAAIGALGKTAGPADLPVLTARMMGGGTAAETAAAREALKDACARSAERDGPADLLADVLAKVPAGEKGGILEIFGALGGPKALAAVAGCARSPDEGIREAALRVLGNWKSEDAGPALIDLAKAGAAEKDRIGALRGLIGLLGTLKFPKEGKIALCRDAAALARTDGERKAVLEAMGNVPAPETYPLLAPFMTSGSLKEEACAVAVAIGERMLRLGARDPDQAKTVAGAMETVLKTTGDKGLAERAQKLFETAGGKK